MVPESAGFAVQVTLKVALGLPELIAFDHASGLQVNPGRGLREIV
jgi:hypothetical protein